MKHLQDMPAQPAPASSKYPERENLFQFLLRIATENPDALKVHRVHVKSHPPFAIPPK